MTSPVALIDASKLTEQPLVKAIVGLSLLHTAAIGLYGVLGGVLGLLDIFESLVFRQWWNIERLRWIAIVLVVGGWIVLALQAKFDALLTWVPVGGVVLFDVLLQNLLFDLPDFLIDLYFIASPALFLPVAAFVLLRLLETSSGADALFDGTSAPPPGAGAPAFTAPPPQAAAPAPAPAAPAPAPTPAPAAPAPGPPGEPGWLADPRGQAQLRWWDGSEWTDHTHDG